MKTKKKKKPAADALRNAVIEHITGLGARPGKDIPFGIMQLPYEFVLETKFGLLGIHPYEDWVACRFDDVGRAKAGFFELYGDGFRDYINPHSGKWNHWYNGWRDEPDGLTYALDLFSSQLRKVMP
jgi:hypothetical protein